MSDRQGLLCITNALDTFYILEIIFRILDRSTRQLDIRRKNQTFWGEDFFVLENKDLLGCNTYSPPSDMKTLHGLRNEVRGPLEQFVGLFLWVGGQQLPVPRKSRSGMETVLAF